MTADPVVSPADTPKLERTIRHALAWVCVGPVSAERRKQRVLAEEAATAALAVLLAVGERDRRQIARLTEALRFYADPVSYENETPRHVRPVITDQGARARAVLADEEDAGDA